MSITFVILYNMKTAISIPDQIFKAAEHLAHLLGMSRSELYTNAIVEFLKKSDDKAITEKLNEIYENEESNLNEKDNHLQINSLNLFKEDW